MEGSLVIQKREHFTISAMFEDRKLVELDFEPNENSSILGNIYTGKVKNIVKNINSAFVEIENGILCYYSLTENKHHIFLNPKKNDVLVEGDEILLQISKENIKTKAPVATCYINLTGKYLILTAGKKHIRVSNKITDDIFKKDIRKLISSFELGDCGIIVRTNAKDCTPNDLEQESNRLTQQYTRLLEIAMYRTCCQLLYKAPANYIGQVRDQNSNMLTKIVTDDTVIYEDMKQYLTDFQQEDLGKLVFHEDPMIGLSSLMNLNKEIEESLRERVWLKSGGYLVIQPTEAMIVIDVNTGKAINKKKSEDHFLMINLEAAKEIARQLRLRNLSGIIIVDFIDMAAETSRQQLMEEFGAHLKKDRIPTTLVDMTKLNLVELTRKKIKKPIYEQLNSVCTTCNGSGFTNYNL